MESGKLVWFGWYYVYEQYMSVEPRHRFVLTKLYTEREWFLKKLSDDIPS